MARTSKSSLSAGMISVLQRMSLKDMLIVGETADKVMADLTQYGETSVEDGKVAELASRENLELAYGYEGRDEETRKPFVFNDGVAVIPIHGTLINRFNSSWGFVTGYNYVRRMLNLALDDDDVDFIVFDVDSPGGEASGCFELAREIMASRRVKPSLAMIDSLAASGGVALGCCATTVYAIPSARVGSIGVYRMHVSYEGALKKDGIKVTFATAGEHKIDGNPYKDLPQAVLDEWTESAGKTWDDFIALVAEARDLSEDDVRATQARVYRADEALDLGLINAVKTTTEAVDAWLAELDGNSSEEDDEMTDKTKGSEVTSGLTEDAVKSMIASAVTGAVSMIARSAAIKEHGASKGQVALAAQIAANPLIDEAAAISMIDAAAAAVAPKAKAKTGKGKQQIADPSDEDEDDDDDADEDGEDGDEDEDGEDGEEAADAARERRLKGGKGKQKAKSSRVRDNVNHLDAAIGRTKGRNPGSGDDEDEQGGALTDEQQGLAILADHNRVAGAGWSGLKPAKKSKAA
jgi:signal peptide peptidase SppA